MCVCMCVDVPSLHMHAHEGMNAKEHESCVAMCLP